MVTVGVQRFYSCSRADRLNLQLLLFIFVCCPLLHLPGLTCRGQQNTAQLGDLVEFVSSHLLCSFGMVLTRGHGSVIFMGNVSVEEGMTSPVFPVILS